MTIGVFSDLQIYTLPVSVDLVGTVCDLTYLTSDARMQDLDCDRHRNITLCSTVIVSPTLSATQKNVGDNVCDIAMSDVGHYLLY